MGGVSTLGRLHGAGCGRSPVHALAVSLCCQTGALRGVPRRATHTAVWSAGFQAGPGGARPRSGACWDVGAPGAASRALFQVRHASRMPDRPGTIGFFSRTLDSGGDEAAEANAAAAATAAKYRAPTDDPMIVQILPKDPPTPARGEIPAGFHLVQRKSGSQLLRVYQQLAKSRLTFLVVLSAMLGYALCPTSVSTVSGMSAVGRLLALAGGTGLCSASANALNQIVETPYDAQMARTRARPLPRRALSPGHAFAFAGVTGVSGVALLAALTNPLTAALGGLNIALYSFTYTPMKRMSIANTWLGAVVGAIPPLMGWASCTGTLFQSTDLAGWVLAGILYAWQFPHFNSLAHAMGSEYARGGYRMMAVVDPALNQRVALRYALLLVPLCSLALPLTHVVHPVAYGLLSLVPNVPFAWAAAQFWRRPNEKTARRCFWFSLFHLPAVMLLAMACKSDFWRRNAGDQRTASS